MVTTLDVAAGQIYSIQFPDRAAPVVLEFVKVMRDGRFKLVREETGEEIPIEEETFISMRCSGDAKRLDVGGNGQVSDALDIDPVSLLDPDEPSITLRERARRLRGIEKLKKARTLMFYARCYDDQPSVGKGHVAVNRLIGDNYADALEKGLDWRPDAATLLRAVASRGQPGSRPLAAFFDQHGRHDRAARWSSDVADAAARAVEFYWSKRSITIGDAISQFMDEMTAMKAEREAEGRPITDNDPFPVPTEETVRLWIIGEKNRWRWEQKYGKRDADRRFRGRGRSIEATRPLEYVMIDHTKVDAWAVVVDDDGEPLFAARAWLTMAIDCYSRMVLGAVFSYEPPSISTGLAVIRDMVRRRDWLTKEYGFHKGATDGWGMPSTVIVDNVLGHKEARCFGKQVSMREFAPAG